MWFRGNSFRQSVRYCVTLWTILNERVCVCFCERVQSVWRAFGPFFLFTFLILYKINAEFQHRIYSEWLGESHQPFLRYIPSVHQPWILKTNKYFFSVANSQTARIWILLCRLNRTNGHENRKKKLPTKACYTIYQTFLLHRQPYHLSYSKFALTHIFSYRSQNRQR